MKRYFPAILAVLAVAFSPMIPGLRAEEKAPAAAPAEGELKHLQGTWEGVEKGREDAGKCTLTINGDTAAFVGANPQEWYTATLTIRGDVDPKQTDGKITNCAQPDFIGKISRGIYKVEGDTLTLVGRQPGLPDAPKSFDDGERTRTFVLKKVVK